MKDVIITEKTNNNTINIDTSTSYEIAKMINAEDLKVAYEVSISKIKKMLENNNI